MKFDSGRIDAGVLRRGSVIAEAMPWIKAVTGKTIVIKYGGAAMTNAELRKDVMADIVLLKLIGVNVVLVHGGGKAINRSMDRYGLEVEFKDGQRVTTDEAMEVVLKVLVGEVNQELVCAMNQHGNMAVGISGIDAGTIVAEQASPDLGRVGKVKKINPELIQDLIAADYIPIIASVAIGDDGGYFNVNADLAAGRIAAALGAHKVVYLTDVDGMYMNWPDKSSLVSSMTLDEAEEIIAEGANTGGMIPKLESCAYALKEGVRNAHIINGTREHALLLEALTNEGIGTMVKATDQPFAFDEAPIGNFAAKLIENV